MHVEVDTKICQFHGQCTYVAPEVFSFADNGDLIFRPEAIEGREDEVSQAADDCPVQAILING